MKGGDMKMCKWHKGTYKGNKVVKLYNGKEINVDECIHELVQAINDAGILTLNSCCGHSVIPVSIILETGLHMIIATHDQAQIIYKQFPSLNDLPGEEEANETK